MYCKCGGRSGAPLSNMVLPTWYSARCGLQRLVKYSQIMCDYSHNQEDCDIWLIWGYFSKAWRIPVFQEPGTPLTELAGTRLPTNSIQQVLSFKSAKIRNWLWSEVGLAILTLTLLGMQEGMQRRKYPVIVLIFDPARGTWCTHLLLLTCGTNVNISTK